MQARCPVADLLGFHPQLVRRGIFKGVDLAALVERFWRLESMRVVPGRAVPTIIWHAHERGGAWGRAHTAAHSIHVRLSEYASIEEAVELLLHEVVHCACPPDEHHGELFKRRLIACAREAFGLFMLSTADLLKTPRGGWGCVAYAIDDVIRKAMTAAGIGSRLREDPETRFEPPPPETEFDIIAREAALLAKREADKAARIAEREAHARAKLIEWERKLEAAKKRARKWRLKVRHYERRQEAAKRRS